MKENHQKIIDTIINKANSLCPDSLALIGVYGSEATGDTHAKSDLDLLILINDPNGRCLADTFILDDDDIGYDLYCTTWKMLEEDSECTHAHLSKLLDSQLVYVNKPSDLERLRALQHRARSILCSDERFEKARKALVLAKLAYAECMLCDTLEAGRVHAGGVIHHTADAFMLFHGRYFLKGVKRTFEELSALNLPVNIADFIMNIVSAETLDDLQNAVTSIIKLSKELLSLPKTKELPCTKNLAGAYEEIYSNWRNKMHEAENSNDIFSSFMNLVSFRFMLEEIENTVAIAIPKFMSDFDSCDAKKNTVLFEKTLEQFKIECQNADVSQKHYKNIDSFIRQYLNT